MKNTKNVFLWDIVYTHTMLSCNTFHPQKLNANFCSGGFEVIKVFYELTFWGLSWVNVRHKDRRLKKIGFEVVARFLGENIGSQFMPSKQIRVGLRWYAIILSVSHLPTFVLNFRHCIQLYKLMRPSLIRWNSPLIQMIWRMTIYQMRWMRQRQWVKLRLLKNERG